MPARPATVRTTPITVSGRPVTRWKKISEKGTYIPEPSASIVMPVTKASSPGFRLTMLVPPEIISR
ncbi:hypothetical protein GCM10023193_61080 [Planotetraspora kaengkrachanensis]|uniref:Uncharacterized protein n=1 Tax=Planotetraspora kaengkrachanensis TaxID=575193 RepID=A0A8J3PWU9_9ACTN|nr:hypothetical protein Pka01_56760 [Planotetraspora kaengkrachanensis]